MTDGNKNHIPPLGDPGSGKALRIATSLTGAIPFAGPVIQSVITEIIPNVRLERIEAYIKYLQDNLDEIHLKTALKSESKLDLFEEGMWQSARAFTKERQEYIAKLVSHGLGEESTKQDINRHFLRILNQIDDRQIILLVKYHPDYSLYANTPKASEYRTKQGRVVDPGISIKDLFDVVGRAEAEAGFQLNASMIGQLASLGLLEEDGNIENVGTPLKTRKFHINNFGKDFLQYIGAV